MFAGERPQGRRRCYQSPHNHTVGASMLGYVDAAVEALGPARKT